MIFLEKLSPKRFRSAAKKRSRRSVSRSEPTSFSSGSTSSSSSSSDALSIPRSKGLATPTSVLRSEISGDWADPSPEGPFELAQAFKLIDKDGDGKITRQELAAVLRRVGRGAPSEAELVAMLGEVDRDGDGCISLEEFGAIGSAFGPACGSELRDVFQLFDKDGDGRITAEELLRVFEAIGDDGCTIDDCRLMIDGVSKTGDGFVCFEDFARMMEQQR